MKKQQENQMITQLLAFDDVALSFENSISEVEVLRTGEWKHPSYGKMIITQETLDDMINNFNARLRKGVYFTEGHPIADEELPAVAWVTGLRKLGESLKAVVEWTQDGMELLQKRSYKFFSPEFYFTYEDPETRQKYKNVLTGGALTNRPYFKSLEAVMLSESMLTSNKKAMFKLEEVLAKEAEAINADERAFLITMSEDLDENDIKKFSLAETKVGDKCAKCADGKMKKEDGGLICSSCGAKKKMSEADAQETEEEKTAREALEKEADDKKAADEAEAAKKAEEEAAAKAAAEAEGDDKKIEMSEKAFKAKEDELAQAKKELSEMKFKERKNEISNSIEKLKFSEYKKEGIFLPKSVDKVQEFCEGLSEDQQAKFFEIMEELPKKSIFGEIGKGGEGDADMEGKPEGVDEASWKLDQTAKQIQTSEKKADGTPFTYSEALMIAEKRVK
jgi:hypothetical protein